MKPPSVTALANRGLRFLIIVAWTLAPMEVLLGRGYELISASVQPAQGTLAGGAYSMQAGAAPGNAVQASGGGYAVVAEAANLVVIESVTLPSLRISWSDSGAIRVVWFDPTDRFSLQIASSLGPDAHWSPVDAVTQEGATAVFADHGSAVGGARFFRLRGN